VKTTATFAEKAELALPFVWVSLMPVLPMVVLLADVLPRGIAIGGKGYAVAFAAIASVAAIISLIAMIVRRGVRALWQLPLAGPLLALIGSAILAGVIGVSFRASLSEIVALIANFLVFATMYLRMRDDEVRRKLLVCFLSAGIVATVFALALTLTRHPPEMFAYQHGRAAGTFLQPNEFAGYLLFLVAIGLAQAGAPVVLRRLGFAAAGIGVVALVLSFSRAAWLGFIVGAPVLVWRFGRRALFAYAVAAAIFLALGTTTFRDVAHDPSENTSRIAVWQGAVRIAERFALTGVGPLGFSKVYPSLKIPQAAVDEVHAHDVPLNVLVENGVLGLAALAWLVIAATVAVVRTGAVIPAHDRERTLLYDGLAAALIASALQNAVDVVTTFVFLLWWPMLGLLLALAPERARAAQPERTRHGQGVVDGRSISTAPLSRMSALGILVLSLSACSGASGPRTAPSPTPAPAANYYIVANGLPGRPVQLSEIASGRLEYLLRAAQIAYETADSKGTLNGVTLTFYKGRTERLRVTAPVAEVFPNSRNVRLSGGVHAASASGAALAAQTVQYDGRRHVLVASGAVDARDGRGNALTGDRAEADLDLHTMYVWGPNGRQTMTFGK